MADDDPLLDEIAELLEPARASDDPERIARTLTDGYARALALEAECARFQERISALAARLSRTNAVAGADELASLAERLDESRAQLADLRNRLVRLRARHALARRDGG